MISIEIFKRVRKGILQLTPDMLERFKEEIAPKLPHKIVYDFKRKDEILKAEGPVIGVKVIKGQRYIYLQSFEHENLGRR